jgi:predicted RNase H-like nuclease (RuvC/YqgF family)
LAIEKTFSEKLDLLSSRITNLENKNSELERIIAEKSAIIVGLQERNRSEFKENLKKRSESEVKTINEYKEKSERTHENKKLKDPLADILELYNEVMRSQQHRSHGRGINPKEVFNIRF